MQILAHFAGVKAQPNPRTPEDAPDSGFDGFLGQTDAPDAKAKPEPQATEGETAAPVLGDSDDVATLSAELADQDGTVPTLAPGDDSPAVLVAPPTSVVDNTLPEAVGLLVGASMPEVPRPASDAGSVVVSLSLDISDMSQRAAPMSNAPLVPRLSLPAESGSDAESAGVKTAATDIDPVPGKDASFAPRPPMAQPEPEKPASPLAQGLAVPSLTDQDAEPAAHLPDDPEKVSLKSDMLAQISQPRTHPPPTEISVLFRQAGLERDSRPQGQTSPEFQVSDRGWVMSGPVASTAPAPPQTIVSLVAPPQYPPPAQQVAQAIVTALRQGSTGQIEVVLRPRELGQIRFEMIASGEKIHVMVSAERGESMDLIRRNVDQLMADLRQSGFHQATLGFGGWAAQDRSAKGDHATMATGLSDPDGKAAAATLSLSSPRLTAAGRLDLRL